MVNAQEYINEKLSTQGSQRAVKKLRIGRITSGWTSTENVSEDTRRRHEAEIRKYKEIHEREGWTVLIEHLEGELDLNAFSNLKELVIISTINPTRLGYDQPQGITKLKVNQCWQLEEVYLENGKLESLDFEDNKQLTHLGIYDQKQLTSLKGLGKNLAKLTIARCTQLSPIDITNCPNLMEFCLMSCPLISKPLRRFFEQKKFLGDKYSHLIRSRKVRLQAEITLIKEALRE